MSIKVSALVILKLKKDENQCERFQNKNNRR